MDANELMTIRDLAERWSVSVETAKKHVRRKDVPYFQVGTDADMRVNWGMVRFRRSDVQRWEQDSTRVFGETNPDEAKAKATVSGRHKFVKYK